MLRFVFHLGAIAALGTTFASAQSGNPAPMPPLKTVNPKLTAAFDRIARTRSPLETAISPDGSTVAWAARTAEITEIHLTAITATGAVDDAREQTVSAGEHCMSTYPLWSPDGESLAFLAACGNPQQQIWLWNKKSNAVRQLTHANGELQMPMWAPDGKSIAFLFVENATRNAGALAPMKPWSGIIGEDGVEVQRVAEIFVNETDPATLLIQLTPANLHVYEFSWSPDSQGLLYVAAEPPGENNWWIARLFAQKISTHHDPRRSDPAEAAAPRVLVGAPSIDGELHGMQIAVPRYAPDGKQIVFIGGLMSDEASNGGDLFLVPATGGKPVNLTPNHQGSPAYFSWLNDRTLKVSERSNGATRLFDLDVKSHAESNAVRLRDSIAANIFVSSFSVSGNGRLALVRTAFDHPPEVWAGPAEDLHPVTHLNAGLESPLGKTESIEWENEGFHVQGWLIYPVNYDPGKRYPLIVSVHGGPSSAVTPRWPSTAYNPALFSAAGYFVFLPNPRGSFGEGERFTRANVKDFGYGDLRDILTGMDLIEKRVPIDKSREGLTGWSYGGFMTMFGVTQTTRFRAAVAGAGISNYQSYYGQNSIDQWLIPFFGKSVYDDPAVYAKSSAITFIHNVKTPTLVVVGDRDGECPAPQSFEFWHALRDLGVKTQLVVYPNEGHSFQQPAHRIDVLQRALNWFDSEMPPQRSQADK